MKLNPEQFPPEPRVRFTGMGELRVVEAPPKPVIPEGAELRLTLRDGRVVFVKTREG